MKRYILLFLITFMALNSFGQSSTDAFYRKGMAYYNCQEYDKAFTFFEKAASMGHADGMMMLGYCYREGIGTPQDNSQAFLWIRKAAEKDNAPACALLGDCYTFGDGVQVNPTQAYIWYKKAAEKGHANACFQLAQCYHEGYGVSKDYSQAFLWIKKAAEKDVIPAYSMLATCYGKGEGVARNYSQAFYWYQKGTEQGDVLSYVMVAKLYFLGLGVEQNYSKAIFWLNKAAEQDNVTALNELALMYAKGQGVSRDYTKAYSLIDRAIAKATKDGKFFYLDTKGEIALMAGDQKLAQDIWKEFKSEYPDKVNEFSSRDENVFVKTMLKGLDDIDNMIPITNIESPNTFAFIIANEAYKRISQVPYAKNDGEIFAEYCKKTLGLPDNNVKIWTDATLGDMQYAISKIKQIADAYEKDANIILYYAGHGIPSDDQQNSYLLPVDGYGAAESSISLHNLYKTLGELDVKSVFVILDACFSGAQRNGEMFASTRGVAIKPKQESTEGKLIVLSAAQGDETAMPYNDKEHGLFSYFLLKKLQESKGDCTIGELADYVTTNVKRTSITIGDKMQTPKVSASSTLGDWRNIKLK